MRRVLVIVGACLALAACDDMTDQPRQRGYAPAASPARPPSGTVAYQDKPVAAPAVTMALLQRGQERFRIYCTPCHSELGDGNGMIVQRGFPRPPSYHVEPLLHAPVQHFYDVITNGYGAMFPYAARVAPPDRWAIAAYIRALQASDSGQIADVPPEHRKALQ